MNPHLFLCYKDEKEHRLKPVDPAKAYKLNPEALSRLFVAIARAMGQRTIDEYLQELKEDV